MDCCDRDRRQLACADHRKADRTLGNLLTCTPPPSTRAMRSDRALYAATPLASDDGLLIAGRTAIEKSYADGFEEPLKGGELTLSSDSRIR